MDFKNTIMLWIMLIFYIFILFYNLISTEPKPSFKKLNFTINSFISNQNCKVNADCNNNELCVKDKCIPTYRGTSYCNSFWGSWVVEKINGVDYVKCTCLYPNVMSQKFEGADCDVDVACATNGQLKSRFIQNILDAECECKKGYIAVKTPRLGCKKLLPFEHNKTVCDDTEIHISKAGGVFHPDYLRTLPPSVQCLKKPCSYNVFNDSFLKHSKFDPNYGCICDPRYGNIGVKFDTTNNYLITDGYDACANIFEKEAIHSQKVSLYTYFYILDKEPKSFIQYTNIEKDLLVKQLQNFVKSENIQISEIWPYNYSQYIFENSDFHIHTRECEERTFLFIEYCNEQIMRKNHMIDCHQILDTIPQDSKNQHLKTYALLYKYPVCKYTSSNMKGMYRNRYILNPYFLSFKEQKSLLRTNGIKIQPSKDDWTVVLASADFDKYEAGSVHPTLPAFHTIPYQRTHGVHL